MINIVMLNWNSLEDIYNNFEVISGFKDKENIRLIIVNNDCVDIDIVAFSNSQLELHVVNNGCNLGYTGGNNAGYKYIVDNSLNGDVLIINPDVKIDESIVNALASALNIDGVAAAMPIAVDENNITLYRNIKLSGFIEHRSKEETSELYLDTDYVAGSCFALKRVALDKTFLFDNDYFLYWEEVDLSLRLRKLGFKLLAVQNAKVERRSNEIVRQINSQYYLVRNSFLIRSKNTILFSIPSHFIYLNKRLLIAIYLSIKVSNIRPLANFMTGLIDGMRGKYEKR